MPNIAEEGNNAIPHDASTRPESTMGRRPRPRGVGAVRGRTGPRHEQQQNVVDGHDQTNGGAMLAERVPHE
jgi:hypothetical protein